MTTVALTTAAMTPAEPEAAPTTRSRVWNRLPAPVPAPTVNAAAMAASGDTAVLTAAERDEVSLLLMSTGHAALAWRLVDFDNGAPASSTPLALTADEARAMLEAVAGARSRGEAVSARVAAFARGRFHCGAGAGCAAE